MTARDESLRLLRELSLAAGPPGFEDEVRRRARRALDGVGRVDHDRLGSLICTLDGPGGGPRVLIDSHLDEVGFMVQKIGRDGMLPFVPLGGWWGHVLLGQRVDVLTSGGRVPGVIGSKPPHFLSAAEREKVLPLESMMIDVGASDRGTAESLGIRIGDPVVPHAEFVEMGPEGVVSGKALDNRIGVALMCESLVALADGDRPNTVIGVGAVQEEVGARGAETASSLSRPDVALVLECTPADDLPGESDPQARLGGGPQIRHYDPTAIASRRLLNLVRDEAERSGIGLQMAVRRTGGTDAGAIHRAHGGVPAVVIGVPGRYIHSHVSLMQISDYRAALRLIVATVRRLDGPTVAGLTRFDD